MKIIGFKLVSLAILGGFIGGCSTYTEQVVSQSFQPAEAPVILAKASTMNGAIFQPGRSGLFATDQPTENGKEYKFETYNFHYLKTSEPANN